MTKLHRVLVIDDEEQLRWLIEKELEYAGHTVKTLSTGRDIATVIADWKPTLILLDVMLPEMDGYAVLRDIRQLPHAPPVWLMSAYQRATLTAALMLGAHGFIHKGEESFINEILRVVEQAPHPPEEATP